MPATIARMSSSLLAEPFEPVRERGAAAPSVRQLSHEERERLGVAGHAQRSCIDGLEAGVAVSDAATFFPRAPSPP